MRQLILIAALSLLGYQVTAQITITASDMPVSGDTLRYSSASVVGASINLFDSGANKNWDFHNLVAIAQTVDTYKTAVQVSSFYALTAPAGCYGYKVADSIPGLGGVLPVSIQGIYTFFNVQAAASSYAAVAFGASLSGIPLANKYDTVDNWYFFPLSYGRRDSSRIYLNVSLSGIGSLKEEGFRITKADGWGKIKTPFYTTPVNCLRLRSEVHQIDSVSYSTFKFGIPVNTVEYKFLVNGQHYPAMWITTTKTGSTETITTIYYRDSARAGVSVPEVKHPAQSLTAYPNPTKGTTKISVPTAWGDYSICVYDVQGREVAKVANKGEIDLSALPAGQYLARVVARNNTGYSVIAKQ